MQSNVLDFIISYTYSVSKLGLQEPDGKRDVINQAVTRFIIKEMHCVMKLARCLALCHFS